MRYFLDTEFDERCTDGIARIAMISIGIVCEDGREFYAENDLYDFSEPGIDPWLIENVKPHLRGGEHAKHPDQIRAELTEFFAADQDKDIRVYAYFADYDWVVLCSLFGRMIDLPDGMPRYCLDLKQMMVERGLAKNMLPVQEDAEHDALADARWNQDAYKAIIATDTA